MKKIPNKEKKDRFQILPSMNKIDKLINSPYEEPKQHWSYVREIRSFELKEGRRHAGYITTSENSRTFDDPGIFVQILHTSFPLDMGVEISWVQITKTLKFVIIFRKNLFWLQIWLQSCAV